MAADRIKGSSTFLETILLKPEVHAIKSSEESTFLSIFGYQRLKIFLKLLKRNLGFLGYACANLLGVISHNS